MKHTRQTVELAVANKANSDKITQAAERLRRTEAGEDCKTVYKDWKLLANAYLAEHRADDSEPVDEEWLKSTDLERQYIAPGCIVFWSRTQRELFEVRIQSEVGLAGPSEPMYTGSGSVTNHASRGQVRRLLEALGLDLKESQNDVTD